MDTDTFGHIAENLRRVRERMAAAVCRAGREAGAVRLVAVSKNFPAAAVAAAWAEGQSIFGENRVQELTEKAAVLPSALEWHLIGHLQSNKAGKAVAHAACIQAVDSAPLIARLERLADDAGKRLSILLEVNVSGEESKFGLRHDDEVRLCLAAARDCAQVEARGLMTMAPFGAPVPGTRRIFAALREMRDRLAAEFAMPLPELSMGMSDDFEAAIAEGATLVRIGTAIFGKR